MSVYLYLLKVILMANLATVQEQIKNMKDGKEVSQKDIFDAQAFIATERRDRPKTNASLETFFAEWEWLISQKKVTLSTWSQTVMDNTNTQLGAAKAQITASHSLESIKTDITRELSVITDADITRMSTTLSSTENIISMFEKVGPAEREAVRGFFGLSLLRRLSFAGYQVTLISNKIEVKPTPGSKSTQAQAVQLETFLNREPIMQTNIAYGLIYGSSRFQEYAIASTKIEGDKKTVPTPTRNYLEYLSDANKWQSQNQISLEDQALFASRSSIDTILRDQKQVNGLILGAPQIWVALQTLANNQVQAQQAAQALIKATQAVPANTTPQSTNSTPPANNMLAKYLGKAGLAVEGGASDLMNTPGAMPALIMAFIATWIFGDFKKALMVLGGAFGISAIANVVQNPKADEAKPTQPQNAKNLKQAPVNVPVPKTIDTSKMTPSQKKAVEKIEKDPQLTDMVAIIRKTQISKWWVETADMADYINFIHSDHIQKRKISEVLNPQDFKFSIFSDEASFDRANQNNLNTMMLKRIMRVYLWEPQNTDTASGNLKKWEKEKNNFIEKHKTVISNQNSTFMELTQTIHK
jgi:hypothetical protein